MRKRTVRRRTIHNLTDYRKINREGRKSCTYHSPNDCGCCADVHFGALLNQSARVIRRALDARISGVNPDSSGVRGMVLGDIVRANRNGRDVYQRDIEQWFNIRRSSVTALLQGMEQDGFITRCAVEKDARLKRLVATDKGRACHVEIEASIATV